MGKFKDLTGMKFGKLKVLERAGYDNHKKILWKCECDCGNFTVTHGRDLVNGHCKSCGCALNERRREEGKYRGLSDTRPFRTTAVVEYSSVRNGREHKDFLIFCRGH